MRISLIIGIPTNSICENHRMSLPIQFGWSGRRFCLLLALSISIRMWEGVISIGNGCGNVSVRSIIASGLRS